jgi:signal transduction histidine kinase
MSGEFYLDWATLTISLFNTILLLWLGLTVLLNAEQRTPGIWLAGAGLLTGGAFFLSHSAILGLGMNTLSPAVNFWWRIGWAPVVLSPLAWYIVMLWYAGFWEQNAGSIRRRHAAWLTITMIITLAILVLFVVANPLPSLAEMTLLQLEHTPTISGIPLIFLLYPVYIIGCITLSLDALLRPGPTIRMMGRLARQRARPWLLSAAIVLLLVSILVGAAIFWVVANSQPYRYRFDPYLALARFDLLISLLIAVAVTLTGQAIVTYEIFTGRVLPRRGLQRYWRRAIVLAAGYGAIVSWSLTANLPEVYTLLLGTCLLVAFYALLSWRSYVDRNSFMAQLRPFVGSQRMVDLITAPGAAQETASMQETFQVFAHQILGARAAYLAPFGTLAPLFGPPLGYPEPAQVASFVLPLLTSSPNSPEELCLPVSPDKYGGAVWAVPLWNERGLSGMLLLGEKLDGGLYTQEEIEVARAASERMLDLQASAEMARRLMALQRRNTAENQVLDRRARRVLHDEVLPRLHAAMLAYGNSAESGEGIELLAQVHRQLADLLHDLPAAAPEISRLGLVGALRQVAEVEFKGAFDSLEWQVTAETAEKADHLPRLAAEVLYFAGREAVRNAARHGRGEQASRLLSLRVAMEWEDGLLITIQDNGVGMVEKRSAPESSGQGLALHSTMMAVIGGALTVISDPGLSTRILLTLPASSIENLIQEPGA